MYRVINDFLDLQHNHQYKKGDTYPKTGAKTSDERVKELKSPKNRLGKALIEEIKEEIKKEIKEELPNDKNEEVVKPKKKNKK